MGFLAPTTMKLAFFVIHEESELRGFASNRQLYANDRDTDRQNRLCE